MPELKDGLKGGMAEGYIPHGMIKEVHEEREEIFEDSEDDATVRLNLLKAFYHPRIHKYSCKFSCVVPVGFKNSIIELFLLSSHLFCGCSLLCNLLIASFLVC